MNHTTLRQVTNLWGIEVNSILPDAEISGSPERSLKRMVVQDTEGGDYLLEVIEPSILHRKNRIAHNLEKLKKTKNTLRLNPYLKNTLSAYITPYDDQYWMLSAYSPSLSLSRPGYLEDSWRGPIMAKFLLELKQTAQRTLHLDYSYDFPDLKSYVSILVQQIKTFNPDVYREIEAVWSHLNHSFFPSFDALNLSFCHGDYHPVNLLWNQNDISKVIDWEFTGPNLELYDAANMISCLGMENPNALEKDIALNFIYTLQKERFGESLSWSSFVDLVITIRFAWISEWLRKKDTEMIELETVYMNILLKNRSKLHKSWQIPF